MKVIVTGSSSGIGKGIAQKFLQQGHQVVGIDVLPQSIEDENYTHFVADIFKGELPEIANCDILVNNAGVQNANDIDVNLKGTIKVTEKYAFHDGIKSVKVGERACDIDVFKHAADDYHDENEHCKNDFFHFDSSPRTTCGLSVSATSDETI